MVFRRNRWTFDTVLHLQVDSNQLNYAFDEFIINHADRKNDRYQLQRDDTILSPISRSCFVFCSVPQINYN